MLGDTITMNETPTQVVITQDKLVDLLLHAATREDIAKLAADTKSDMAKFAADTKSDIAKVAADNRVDNAATLKALESFEARIDRQFQKIDHRYNWIIATVLACTIGLAGLMLKIH